jgi:hypothetical protein
MEPVNKDQSQTFPSKILAWISLRSLLMLSGKSALKYYAPTSRGKGFDAKKLLGCGQSGGSSLIFSDVWVHAKPALERNPHDLKLRNSLCAYRYLVSPMR